MKVKEVQSILEAQFLVGEENLESEVRTACGSDMMSDVLAFVKDQALLLTGLVNLQVIRTAEMMDIRVIVFVRGKKPDDEVLELAKEHDITLLSTQYPLYVACGRLYEAGLRGNLHHGV